MIDNQKRSLSRERFLYVESPNAVCERRKKESVVKNAYEL